MRKHAVPEIRSSPDFDACAIGAAIRKAPFLITFRPNHYDLRLYPIRTQNHTSELSGEEVAVHFRPLDRSNKSALDGTKRVSSLPGEQRPDR